MLSGSTHFALMVLSVGGEEGTKEMEVTMATVAVRPETSSSSFLPAQVRSA